MKKSSKMLNYTFIFVLLIASIALVSGLAITGKVVEISPSEYSVWDSTGPIGYVTGGTPVCTDSDGGKNYDVKGYTNSTANGFFSDYCYEAGTWNLKEYYCRADGYVEDDNHLCPYGCSNGACVQQTCTDSDGGKNYNVKGYATTDNGYTKYWDSCTYYSDTGKYVLHEIYCDGNNIRTQAYTCPGTCSNGACVQATPVCGNGVRESGEECDGQDLGGRTCLSMGYQGGTLRCTSTCRYDTSECFTSSPVCGNGVIETGEQCDGTNLGGKTCADISNYIGGTLRCTSACRFDLSGCLSECTDSDGGKNYNVKGTVKGLAGDNVFTTDTDSCRDSTWLIEWFCSGVYRTNTNYNCPYGCENGACKPEPVPKCYDSDGGKDYYVKGYITYEGYVSGGELKKEYDMCAKDITTGEEVLQEKYCPTTGGMGTIDYKCPYPYTCKDGACVKEPISECTDSDGGKVYNVAGTTSGTFGSAQDTCASPSSVYEHYCSNYLIDDQIFFIGPSNYEFVYSSYSPSERVIYFKNIDKYDNLAFSVEPDGKFTLITEGKGYLFRIMNIAQSGSPIQYLDGELVLKEKVKCDSLSCSNGACQEYPATCTDSDGGKNYYVKGTCVDAGGSNPDSCATGSDGSVVLSERYCNTENRCDVAKDPTTNQYGIKCPYGCENGACLKEPTSECTDSDGGKNYYVKGSATAINMGTTFDVCQSGVLSEAYCSNGEIKTISFTCPSGCGDGACNAPECRFADFLLEGRTRTHTMFELDYEVTAVYIDGQEVKLSVNGMLTKLLSPGESDRLGSEVTIKVLQIINDPAQGDAVVFCFMKFLSDDYILKHRIGDFHYISTTDEVGCYFFDRGYDSCDYFNAKYSYPKSSGLNEGRVNLEVYPSQFTQDEFKNEVCSNLDCDDNSDGLSPYERTMAGNNYYEIKTGLPTSRYVHYLWISKNIILEVRASNWNEEMTGPDIFDEMLLTYFNKYPSTLVFEQQNCTDSDGGKNYYVKGQCTFATTTGSGGGAGAALDTCVGSSIVKECYCENNQLKLLDYTCPYGCENGACLSQAPSPDLADFPDYFFVGNDLDVKVVVGASAPTSDVVGAIDIVATLTQTAEGQPIPVGIAVLDNTISDPFAINLISVGNPCNNKVSMKLMGNPASCTQGLSSGKGMIKLFSNNNKVQILASGYDKDETLGAARILANYQDYDLKGTDCSVLIVSDLKAITVNCEKIPVTLCTDSDGGKNYYVQGTTQSGTIKKTDSCTYCTGACPIGDSDCKVTCSAVVEYYCEGGSISSETHVCENLCENGACIKKPGQIRVLYPNGGEEFVQGTNNKISWSGGKNLVHIGLVKEKATNGVNIGGDPYLILGWIDLKASPDSSTIWDAKEVCDLSMSTCWPVSPGRYKIVALSEDERGNMVIWDGVNNKQGNWDVSDSPFSIVTTPTPVCTETDNGRDFYVKGLTSIGSLSKVDQCDPGLQGVVEFYCPSGVLRQGSFFNIEVSGEELVVQYLSYVLGDYFAKFQIFSTIGPSDYVEVSVIPSTGEGELILGGQSFKFIVTNPNTADSPIKLIGVPAIFEEHFICPNGCKDGACIPAPNTCYSNSDCKANYFCEFPAGICNGPGSCVVIPGVCISVYAPVCGCDGKTYSNDCIRQTMSVSKKHEGKCDEPPLLDCDEVCKRKGFDYGKCKPGPMSETPVSNDIMVGGWCSSDEVDLGAELCPQLATPVYPGYCLDGVKNYDETNDDCGGSCKPCGGIIPIRETFHCCCAKKPVCIPVCKAADPRSEGWYDSCTGELIRQEKCTCRAVCKSIGTRSEGYYSSCTGSLIKYDRCGAEQPITVTIRRKPIEIEQIPEQGIVIIKSEDIAITREKLMVEEESLGLSTTGGIKPINYLPEEVKQTAVSLGKLYEVTEIELISQEEKPVYEVDGKTRQMLLWIIPIYTETTVLVDAETNQVIK